MKRFISLIVVLFLLTPIIYNGCSEDTTSPASQCDQSCQDDNTAYGLVHTYNFIWNQYFAGQPTGTHDKTVNGPKGGTIHITGTTAYSSNGINTVHLVFVMTDCKGLDENYSLTFNGTMNVDGTFSSVYKAMGFVSDQLSYQGTVGKNANVPVNGMCAITINETQSNLSGIICGREFSY